MLYYQVPVSNKIVIFIHREIKIEDTLNWKSHLFEVDQTFNRPTQAEVITLQTMHYLYVYPPHLTFFEVKLNIK